MGVQLHILSTLQEILAPPPRIVFSEDKRAEHFAKKSGTKLVSIELVTEPADTMILATDAAENMSFRGDGAQGRVCPRAAHTVFGIDRQIDIGFHAAWAFALGNRRISFLIRWRKPNISSVRPIFDEHQSMAVWP